MRAATGYDPTMETTLTHPNLTPNPINTTINGRSKWNMPKIFEYVIRKRLHAHVQMTLEFDEEGNKKAANLSISGGYLLRSVHPHLTYFLVIVILAG